MTWQSLNADSVNNMYEDMLTNEHIKLEKVLKLIRERGEDRSSSKNTLHAYIRNMEDEHRKEVESFNYKMSRL